MHNALRAAGFFAILSLVAGCECAPPPASGDAGLADDAPPSGDATTDAARPPSTRCTRDTTRIAARQGCLGDDHCPCGTFCSFGECTAACTTDTDCATSERCDDFGRCRDAAAEAIVPLPVSSGSGAVIAAEGVTTLASGALEALVRFEVRNQASPVHVAASDDAEVACAPGEAFGSECDLTRVEPDTEALVRVRPRAGAAADATPQLALFSESDHVVVTVLRADQRVGSRLDATGASPPLPIAGSYTGTARLDSSGMSPDDEGLEALTTFPVTAEIWGAAPGTLTLRIADAYHVLASDGVVVGTAAVTEAAGVYSGPIAAPVQPFATGALSPGDTWTVLAAWTQAELRGTTRTGELTIGVRLELRGTGIRPWVDVNIELARSGEPSGAAMPAAEAPAMLGYSETTRLTEPTAWESALTSRFPAYASLTGEQKMERYQFVLGEPALDACAGLDSGAQRDASRAWYGMSHGGSDWRTDAGLVFELLASVDEPGVGADLGDLTLPYDAAVSLGAVTSVICAGVASVDISQPPGAFFISGTVPFDHCEQLAAATACTLGEASVGSNVIDLPVTGTVRETPASPFRSLVVGETVRVTVRGSPTGARLRVCTMPAAPSFCAELTSCLEPSAGSTHASVVGPVLGVGTIPSGDVRCASGARTGAIDLDTLAATLTVPATQSVEGCIADLTRLRTAPAATGTFGSGVSSVFATSSCIDAARVVAAIGYGLDGDSTGGRAQAYAARLLQRWLDVHGSIASEAHERSALYDMVQSIPGAPVVTDPADALSASLGAWDLLFQPVTGGRLDALPVEVLAEPDYRLGMAGVSIRAGDEQGMGLAVAIVTAAAAQLRLLHAILEDEWLESGTPPTPDRLHGVLPRITVARALASGLAARAGLGSGVLAWEGTYRAADLALLDEIGRLSALVQRAQAGASPLGIEDADLPLYFLDDATGPGGRFAAVSDFLIGTGPGSTAWVPSLVAASASAEAGARAAWIDEIDRDTRRAMSRAEHDRYVSDVRGDYNQRLRNYCGTTSASLVDDRAFEAMTCALDPDPACQDDDREVEDSWTIDDILGRMCLASEYAEAYILTRTGRPDRDTDVMGRPSHPRERRLAPMAPYGTRLQFFAIDCYRGVDTRISIRTCADGLGDCIFCDSGLVDPGLEGATDSIPVSSGTLAYIGRMDDAHFGQLQACQELFPEMRESVPLRQSRFYTPGCVHGSLGDAFAAIAQADSDIEIARAEAAEHMEAYDIAMRSCFILEEANTQIVAANDAHVSNMSGLIHSRADVESSAAVLGTVSDCLATMAGVVGTIEDPDDMAGPDGLAIGLGIGSCATGIAAGALESQAAQFQADIEVAEVEHDALVSNLEAAAETDICFNDARLELVGLRAATVRIQAASTVRGRALTRLSEMTQEVQRIHDEGYAALSSAEGPLVTPPGGELWASATLRSFEGRFRLARRATYLAVRAVEHEFQASLMARQAALAADSSEDLESVLTTLWTTAGTRSIGGSRPSDLHVVLSLRDDILQLGDESTAPPGLHGLSPIERLRVVLADERYAVRDETGRLTGLQIPFTLAPLGAVGFPTGGIPIYGTTDCAERVWSVNSSILGTDVWRGSDTTFTRIDLLKQNTFFSQWCGAAPRGEPFQVASVRPSNNLFLEPGFGEGVSGPFGLGETELFSRARMQAFFGVTRAELEDPRYANGETSELAARGLFGEYAIFIPAELVSREVDGGGRTDGLVLDHVDDILLRLDYVSVAR